MRSEDDDVIATRTFERDDGDVLFLLHKPQPYPKPEIDADPANPPWRCFFTIRFPNGEIRRRSATGIDGIQAMLLTIEAAGRAARYLEDGTGGLRPAVRWLGKDDLGLNISVRD